MREKITDPYKVIKHPLSTEKSIRLMEAENKLLFVVERKANKNDVKNAIEKMFKAKVKKVNTFIAKDGKKRAYIKFSDETPAIDIATQLGLM
jgi:ribosomal protein uL23